MTDKKISELVSITGGNVDDTADELVIVDDSATETKRITREELFKGIDGNVGIGTASPSAPFHVEGSFNTAIYVNDTGGNTDDIILADSSGSVRLRNGLGAFSVFIGGDAASNTALNSTLAFRALTNGDIVFYDDAGSSADFYWDASASRLGINETVPNYDLDVNGTIGFTPGSSVTPVDNGDVVIELTDNTTLTFKAKGSDGVVRSATLTLS
jgi:hypothetical protein